MTNKEEQDENKLKPKFPLAYQAALGGLLLLSILSASFFGFVIPRISQYQEERNYEVLNQAALQAGQIVSVVINEVIHNSIVLVNDTKLQDITLSTGERENLLKDYNQLFDVYDDIILLDSTGKVLAASQYNFRTTWSESESFQEALQGTVVFSPVQVIPRPQKEVVNYFVPIQNDSDEIIEVLVFQVDVEDIWRFSEKISVGETGFVFLKDVFGRIVIGAGTDEILSPAETYEGSENYVTISLPVEKINGHVGLPDWEIVAVQERQEFYFGSNFVKNSIIGILLITSIIMVFLASFVVSVKVRTMRKFSQAMRELESGDLDTELKVKAVDEFGVMARVFNELVQSLRSTRGNLSLLFENAPLGIMTINKDGVVASLNSKMSELVGVESRVVLMNKNILKIRAFQESGLDKFVKQGLAGNNIEVELQFEPLDGTEVQWHHYRGVPVVTEQNGKYERSLMLMASNVTERVSLNKEREQILEELEQKVEERTREIEKKEQFYRSIIDSAATAMCIVEANTLISLANQKFEELTGYAKEEIEGKMSWTQFVDKKFLQMMKKFHEARRRGETKTAPPSSYEFDFVNRRGEKKTARLDISLISGTKQSVASLVDVTAKNAAFKRAKKAEARFEHVAETAHEWIWEVDPKGLYTYSSPAVEDMLGYKSEEIIGKKYFYDLFLPEEREKLKEMTFSAFEKMERFDGFVNANLHKDGHVVHLVTSGRPIVDDQGELNGYRGVDFDQSKVVRMAEELVQASKVRDNFIQVATHELKTPLVPIRLQTELLLDGEFGELSSKQRESLNMIAAGEDRLRNLISDFLMMTKVKTGQIKIKKTKFNLSKTIRQVLKEKDEEIKEKNLSVQNKVGTRLSVSADSVSLKRILDELIENAIKFSKKGGQVSISAKKTKMGTEIKVTDQGIGLTKKEQEKLFEPFYQASTGAARKYEGTGLGLAIAKGLAKAQGGEVKLTSEGRGKGASVIINLPK